MIWCSERAAKVDYLRGASAIASGPRRASPRTVIFRRVDGGVPRLRRAVEELSPREQAAVAKFLKALNSDWTTSRYRRCRTVRTARRSSGAETVMPRPRRETIGGPGGRHRQATQRPRSLPSATIGSARIELGGGRRYRRPKRVLPSRSSRAISRWPE